MFENVKKGGQTTNIFENMKFSLMQKSLRTKKVEQYVQCMKAFDSKPDKPSSIPRSPMVDGKC